MLQTVRAEVNLLKTEEGVVIETDGGQAKVRAGRHAECENCGACPGSGSALIAVSNPLNARVGQRVLFEIQDEKALSGAFLIFVLPPAAAFAGAILGGILFAALSAGVVLGRILGGVLFLALAVAVVRAVDRKHGGRRGALPSIVKILENSVETREKR